MCGIAGYLLHQPLPNLHILRQMSGLLAHRGPDDEGYWALSATGQATDWSGDTSPACWRSQLPVLEAEQAFEHRLAFAHRRYAVTDTSPAGHQPMTRAGLTLVFNGEIYNHFDLRQQLLAYGHTFHTHSDTEVVLAAWQQWGSGCFSRLRGFWAIALYDAAAQTLLLSRDPLGKAPLYLLHNAAGWWFASDIKPLLAACPEECSRYRETAISAYLHRGWRDGEGHTFWQNIYSLPPATCLHIHLPSGKKATHRYWHFPPKRLLRTDIGIEECATQLSTLLQQAVSRRLPADLPVGFTLSGGLDSATLVALAATASAGDAKLPVFTVAYADPRHDESPLARLMTARYAHRLDHTVWDGLEETLEQGDTWELFQRLQEEPFHDPVLYTDFVQQKRLKQLGIGVCILGAGGDELLAGYPAFLPAHLRWLLRQPGWGKWCQIMEDVAAMGRHFSPDYLRRGWGRGEALWSAVLRQPLPPPALPPRHLEGMIQAKMSDQAMHYWLRSLHKHYMGVPMEPRMPFLDLDVVEFCLQLPPDYLIRDGWSKYVLRRAVSTLLPSEVVWRKQKMGFPFDTESWLHQQKTDICRRIQRAPPNPWLDARRLLEHYDQLLKMDAQRLWRAVCLCVWYGVAQHFTSPPSID